MQDNQSVGVLESVDQVTNSISVATPEQAPSKLSSFLLWRNTPSRFLSSRARSQSDFSSTHPLQSTLQPSISTPDLKIMATRVDPQQVDATKIASPDGQFLQTPSDPRTPSSASTISRNDSVLDANHHPDLHDEVSKLNEKLINAINHQASLDETLQQTRNELDIARKLISKLENDANEARAKAEENDLRIAKELEAETDLRLKAEKDKKAMEQELETLTSALFIEANTMVADARREKETSDKKIEQLRAQLQESEGLLQSHQAQLTDLKTVLERMRVDENEISAQTSSIPSSPILPPNGNFRTSEDAAASAHLEAAMSDMNPEQPLYFTHLVRPILRIDHSAYSDFATLIKQAIAASPPSSRVVSGSYSNLAVNGGSPPATQFSTPTVGAFPSISPRPSTSAAQIPVLRETKVFKKALAEDIEPTLRLDIAPGISWMVRRPIVNSMIDGTLVVEPMPPSPLKGRGLVNQCSLCGENRIGELYSRKHRFRISEDKESKRFPLCDLCLGRLRSCCELLSFLRTITGGHWKADTEEEIRSAWEEFVKLRERIFWHRMAGGVVPVTFKPKGSTNTSARPSLETVPVEAGALEVDADKEDTLQSQDSEAFATPAATPQPDSMADPIAAFVEEESSVKAIEDSVPILAPKPLDQQIPTVENN